MKIGISTAFLGNLRAGTWQYTRHLLQGAAEGGIVAVDPQQRELGVPGLPVRNYPGGGGKLAKLLWPNFVLPANAGRDGFDLIHCTTHYGTFMPCSYRNVITIHDVSPLLFSGTHGLMNVWHHRFVLPAILRRVDRVITVSQSSKRDICRMYDLPGEKVTVTLLAADPCYRPLPPGGGGELVRSLPRPYILNVGTLEPRKNLEGLLRAFSLAKRDGLPHTLVITGARGWGESRLATLPEELGIADSVVFTGFVDDDDLPHLYGGADFFVYPSLYEGFGLPVLEAMACGTPVITANSSSLPEVAGDAALLVDPRSVTELAAAIVRLGGDAALRHELGQRGIHRAAQFSWERTVAQTLAVYADLLGAEL